MGRRTSCPQILSWLPGRSWYYWYLALELPNSCHLSVANCLRSCLRRDGSACNRLELSWAVPRAALPGAGTSETAQKPKLPRVAWARQPCAAGRLAGPAGPAGRLAAWIPHGPHGAQGIPTRAISDMDIDISNLGFDQISSHKRGGSLRPVCVCCSAAAG